MNLMPKAKCCVFVDFCSLFRFVVMPTPDVVFSYALVDVACYVYPSYLLVYVPIFSMGRSRRFTGIW